MSRFHVLTASAKAPRGARSSYRKVAVIECLASFKPSQISARPDGVIRIVSETGSLYEGSTERSAFAQAMAEAKRLAAKKNDAEKTRLSELAADIVDEIGIDHADAMERAVAINIVNDFCRLWSVTTGGWTVKFLSGSLTGNFDVKKLRVALAGRAKVKKTETGATVEFASVISAAVAA